MARAAAARRCALHRAHRRGREGVLHRHRPHGADGRRGRRDHRPERRRQRLDAVHVQRPGRQPRPEVVRPLEAGDRGGQRDGVRRCVLHARRGRVHRRRRARDLLRPARHVRHDRRVRADPHGGHHAVHRDHAALAARQLRAHVGAACVSDRHGQRGGARRRARWPAPASSRRSSRRSRSSRSKARCARSGRRARCRNAKPCGSGYAYVAMGTNQDSIAEGQKLFASGKRVEWKLR